LTDEIVLFFAASDARVTLLPEPRITRYHTGKSRHQAHQNRRAELALRQPADKGRRWKGRPRSTIAFTRAAHTPPLRLSVVSRAKMRLFSPAVPKGCGARNGRR
jgi:hypothetical protein